MLSMNKIMAGIKCPESDNEEFGENYNLEELSNQCQRYEEQIVELHSVIAELSRKLEVDQDDIIPEETETSGEDFDEENNESLNLDEDSDSKGYKRPTNQFNALKSGNVLNKEKQDYNSLVFERDLDSQLKDCVLDPERGHKKEADVLVYCDSDVQKDCSTDINYNSSQRKINNANCRSDILEQTQQELLESRQELDQLKELLTLKDREKEMIILERNSLKRQLNDLQATMEYQDARLDLKKKPSSRKSSTASARFNTDATIAECNGSEKVHPAPSLPALLNSISTPEMSKVFEKGVTSSKPLPRRRSLRKNKKNQTSCKEIVSFENAQQTSTTSSKKSFNAIENADTNVSEQITLSSLSHESSHRDTETKIKINRTSRPPPHTLSSENIYAQNTEKMNGKEDGTKDHHVCENIDLLKNLATIIKQHELQSNNKLLASECADHMIEAYDVLIALNETSMPGDAVIENSNRRETVENVAKHLISRLDMASTIADQTTNSSNASSSMSPPSQNGNLIQNSFLLSNQNAWDDTSGYSHTTGSATSTATSLSSTANTENRYENGQIFSSNDATESHHNVSCKSFKNGLFKADGNNAKCKEVERPDLLSMTPSRNASLNSTSSSPMPQNKSRHITRSCESQLKDHINQLKAERATLQQRYEIQQLSEILSFFSLDTSAQDEILKSLINCKGKCSNIALANQTNMEPIKEAKSDLNSNESKPHNTKSAKEREADLNAQLYLVDQEKRSLEMKLDDRHSLESMLRSHIEHLREENDRLSRGEGRLSSLSREDKLGKRVDSLLETLDRVTKNSEQRQIHSDELMGDLKRANSTLSEALEKNKRKYQSRIKRLEQQLVTATTITTTTTNQNEISNDKSRVTNNQLQPQAQTKKQPSIV